jgi:3-deoxy-D-manno-octulosonate 8-phosphate phosphatase (KDO 8-P phosphatase)
MAPIDLTHIEDHFVNGGGQFIRSAFDIQQRLRQIQALVFDWDGVFNDGGKGFQAQSNFTEVDTLGIHLLRYGLYRATGQLPAIAIISGQENPSALYLAQRDHYTAVYSRSRDKAKALRHFCDQQGITPGQTAYFYDDLLDLSVAQEVGLRFAVGRLANPLLLDYVEQHRLADYISACQGQEHAVREFCELLLGILGLYDMVLESRLQADEKHQEYTRLRDAVKTTFYRDQAGQLSAYQPEILS